MNVIFTLTYSHQGAQRPIYKWFEAREWEWMSLTSPSRFWALTLTQPSLPKWPSACCVADIRKRSPWIIHVSVEFQKCEGDVRENECPSRASSPLYIGHLDGSCEYVRHIFAFHIFSYCKKMLDAFETRSDAFEIGSNALEIRKSQMHGASTAFG